MSKIDNITLDDIYLFIEMYSGKNVVIPEDKKPIMDYMDLLDKIRAMDNRIAEFGSREHIIKYLIVHHSLSRYKASQAYEDAMEFYYCDSQISREALRNRMAQKVEAQINAALLMANTAKDFIAAIKLWKDVFQMLGLDKEDPPKLNAEAAGKMVIPYNSDMKSVAPNAQIAALVLNWGPYYAKKIQQTIDGKWDPTPVWMHYKDGAMSLEGVRTDKIPADIVKKMEEVKAKIESGEFHPFTGPIKTNDGKEAAKAGEVLKDDQLQTMNYYVDGVIGKVPN